MRIVYKSKKTERILIGLNIFASVVVFATFVLLFGFNRFLIAPQILYALQIVTFCFFLAEKVFRFFNTVSKADFWRRNWYEIPLLFILAVVLSIAFFRKSWLGSANPAMVWHMAVGLYLVLEVIVKVCRTIVNTAASGQSPTLTLIITFLVLIICGAGLLMLPKSTAGRTLSFVDALFTSTSATCVTGLIVKDTGSDFSFMGQVIILSLIQLGGLGIIVFGVVFALLLGQALSLRESVAVQDLLNAQTVSRIGKMIAFIFIGTILIETLGAIGLLGLWDSSAVHTTEPGQRWFYSIFHSISAFCNAGFSLFEDSFTRYDNRTAVYLVMCPLIILGGLGFSVLYDLTYVSMDRIKRLLRKHLCRNKSFMMEPPKKMRLQSKIVISVSAILIVAGALAILLFDHFTLPRSAGGSQTGLLDALFQSVTARTAGFNTIDISKTSPAARFVMIVLMFIGGSPGSTAGGIKTVTLAVIVMAMIAALRKRQEVEMFKRSVRIVVVGRAITITLLFVIVLFAAALALSVTERYNSFDMSQIMFEAASALGTVGLTTGITGSLTTAGKLIIIAVMLIGRLGPLTLLAALTFNLKPAKFNYPEEAIIVG